MTDNQNIKFEEFSSVHVVLVVLNSFVNDSRVLKEALSLKGVGMKVSVCAMHESGLQEREIVQGVDIHRIRLRSRSWSKKRIVQVFKYLEFIVRSIARFKSVEVMHCNDLNALPVGVLLKLFNRKVRILYDAHEFEIHRTASQGPLSIKLNFYLERFLIKYADAVTVTSQADADEYASMYNIEKPRVVLNCPALTPRVEHQDVFRKAFDIPPEEIVYLYQGALHEARGIQVMLDAFTQIQDGSACIVFMGFGAMEEKIKSFAASHRSIHFHDAVPPGELFQYTAGADCGIIYMPNSCANHNYALPNKLFEYVMGEIPTLTSPLQEIERVVNEYRLGFVSKAEDAASLLALVKSIKREDLIALEPDLRSAREHFTWENQEKVLLDAYRSILIR